MKPAVSRNWHSISWHGTGMRPEWPASVPCANRYRHGNSLPAVRQLDEKLYDWNTTVNAMTALAPANIGGSSARVVKRQSAAPGRSGWRS